MTTAQGVKQHRHIHSIEALKANGLDDPITFYQKEVDELNNSRKDHGARKISDKSPLLHLGYFPLKSIMEKLNIKKYINFLSLPPTLSSTFMKCSRPLYMPEL